MQLIPETFKDSDLKRVQAILLDMLKAFDRVCRQHGLRYYIIAGTMLGAVRHHGFIPWDDDADVAMPRRDYEILCKNADTWFPYYLRVVNNYTDPAYPYGFARLQNTATTYVTRRFSEFVGGLPVDIFPLDGMTDNKFSRWIHYRRYHRLIKRMYYSHTDPLKHGYGLRWLFLTIYQRIFSREKIHRLVDARQQQWDFDASSLVADHDNKPNRGILPKEVYGQPTPIRFEDTILMGVEKPDEYLKYCYGDYMVMPAKHPPLNFRYIDLDASFEKYKRSIS